MTKRQYQTVIEWLKRRPSQIEWDDIVEEQYAVLREIPDALVSPVMQRMIRECELRPQPATLLRFARELGGERPGQSIEALMGPAQAQQYRRNPILDERLLPSTGESPARQAARESVAGLKPRTAAAAPSVRTRRGEGDAAVVTISEERRAQLRAQLAAMQRAEAAAATAETREEVRS
jgi:hypothetical protein